MPGPRRPPPPERDPRSGHRRGAVLDWKLSTLGDPLADLGGLLAYWPQATDTVPAAPHPHPAEVGFCSRPKLVDAYREASGRATDAIGFWETLGCWELAIITDGVRRSALDGADAEGAARTTDLLLERALDAAERAAI